MQYLMIFFDAKRLKNLYNQAAKNGGEFVEVVTESRSEGGTFLIQGSKSLWQLTFLLLLLLLPTKLLLSQRINKRTMRKRHDLSEIVAEVKNGNRYYDHKQSHIEKGRLLDFIEAKHRGTDFDTNVRH